MGGREKRGVAVREYSQDAYPLERFSILTVVVATCPYTSDKTVANTYIHTISTSKTGEIRVRMVYCHRCQYPGCDILLVSQNATIRRN